MFTLCGLSAHSTIIFPAHLCFAAASFLCSCAPAGRRLRCAQKRTKRREEESMKRAFLFYPSAIYSHCQQARAESKLRDLTQWTLYTICCSRAAKSSDCDGKWTQKSLSKRRIIHSDKSHACSICFFFPSAHARIVHLCVFLANSLVIKMRGAGTIFVLYKRALHYLPINLGCKNVVRN